MKRPAQNKIIIGLTGSFGSGKTTVARMLRSSGAFIIDADRIAHCLLYSDKTIRRKLKKAFGDAIFNKEKTVDRLKLASLVFKNRRLLKILNNAVHPAVIEIIRRAIRGTRRPLIVIDAPLLIEAGLTRMVDKVIVVMIRPRKRMERLLAKTALSEKQIAERLKVQMPQEAKRRFADFVIDNSGSLADTARQVKKVLKKVKKEDFCG